MSLRVPPSAAMYRARTSCVETSPFSIWETRDTVMPMRAATWSWVISRRLRSSASRQPRASSNISLIAASKASCPPAVSTARCRWSVSRHRLTLLISDLLLPLLQVRRIEILGPRDRVAVPAVPLTGLVPSDQQDRRTPRSKQNRILISNLARRWRTEFLHIRQLRGRNAVDQRPALRRTVAFQHQD